MAVDNQVPVHSGVHDSKTLSCRCCLINSIALFLRGVWPHKLLSELGTCLLGIYTYFCVLLFYIVLICLLKFCLLSFCLLDGLLRFAVVYHVPNEQFIVQSNML